MGSLSTRKETRALQGDVGREDGVVGLNHSCGNPGLGGAVNGELQLELVA